MERKGPGGLIKNNGWAIGGPKIVAIGGGTGLSTLLRGLKAYTSNITAIVTVADDGGGSGILRNDLGMLPPGDIRNCILALANTEPIMESLMQYRFKEGSLRGQSFGNLFIAALNDICGSFDNAIREISNVLAVTGRVVPVTLEDITLFAELDDGTIIRGESQIPIRQISSNKKIKRVYLEPAECEAMPEALKAIKEADAVIIGPGSLYTSIIPNFMVKGVAKAVHEAAAMKIYICNMMTQQGETLGYDLSDHINAINEHAGHDIIEYAIVNSGRIPEDSALRYMDEYAKAVEIDWDNIAAKGIKVVGDDFVRIDKGYVRHDYNALSKCIFTLINQK
ncbi:gluconeogenesis factor YvcK family protein [Lutispora saccharofermentans]|uniref:Putative gluconeogenesis factor n=1 Tax=Lutispora saccharofermentans TaxID=3024236 RepID=A0ABT1NKE2_9FIRM|nr:YvcK family protein [Lutispora saccharofermentans]MCQ1531564.1 YvcK family protein [Lutispora saccharofermentans]